MIVCYHVCVDAGCCNTCWQLYEGVHAMGDMPREEYSSERSTATMTVARFLQGYVDVPQFVEYCKACPNYAGIWSCPPYSLDVMDVWRKYETVELIAIKVRPSATLRDRTYAGDQLREIYESLVSEEKHRLTAELLAREGETPNSLFLSGGSCDICPEGCARASNQPCKHPDLMRYSVESLGGNVQKAAQDLLHIEITWPQNGRLPAYFVLVMGFLTSLKKQEEL